MHHIFTSSNPRIPAMWFLAFWSLFLSTQSSLSQIAGPFLPATGTNVVGTGTVNWSNTNNILAADAVYATASVGTGATTRYLQAGNFGFSIPPTATINGISVEVLRFSNSNAASRSISDVVLRMVKNGTIIGSNYANTGLIWPTNPTSALYGGGTDLWGTSWTAADINAANFGVVLSATSNASRTAYVDYFKITVYYTPPPALSGFSPSQACTGTTPAIVLSGNHLTGATGVSFGGTTASFTVNSDSQITAILPAGASTGAITVNTPSGTVSSLSNFVVNPLPVLPAISGINSVCVNGTAQLSNTQAGGNWSSSTPAIASISPSGLVTANSSGTTMITYAFTNASNCTSSETFTMTVNPLPVVSAPAAVCSGAHAQLTPSGGGNWTSNNNTIATVDDTGWVTALAPGSVSFTYTNNATTCSRTTNAMTVLAAPLIVSQPVSQTICSGTAASFGLTATGTALSYQWYRNGNPISNGGAIAGANTATLTINPAQLSDAASDFYCLVSGNCTTGVASSLASLTVIERVGIAGQPVSQSICNGDTAVFAVNASGAGLSYQWYNGATQLIDDAHFSGATSAMLTITNTTNTDASTGYHCVVSGTSPCNPVVSANAALTLNQAPAFTGQPTPLQTVCEGSSVNFNANATGGSISYRWYRGTNMLVDGGNISGASTATLTLNPVAAADAGNDYHCKISNICPSGVSSNMAALAIAPKASLGNYAVTSCSQSAFSVIPSSGNPTSATVIPANTTYSWSAPTVTGGMTGGVAQSDQSSIAGSLSNPTNQIQTATYTVTPTSGSSPACIGTPFTVTVSVNPKPSIQPIDTGICSQGTVNIAPNNGGGNIVPAGTSYSWGYPTVTGGITGGAAGSGVTFGQTLNNPTSSNQTATYNVTPTVNGCSGSGFTITITVYPKPTVVANLVNQTICNASAANLSITNPAAVATSYTWTRNNTASVTGASSGSSGTVAAGNAFNLVNLLTNTTGTAQATTYTITPTANGCPGTPITATVTVQAPAVGGLVYTTAPGVVPALNNITVCHFASGTLYLTANVGNVVRWEYTQSGGMLWTPVANTSNTYNYTNITQTTIFRAVVQNGGSNCALAYSATAMVNVIPNIKPSPVIATPSVICQGQSSVLSSQSGFATSQNIAAGGSFSSSNPANWTVDGCGNCLNAGASNTSPGPFQLSASNGGTYSGVNYSSSGKFAVANGNFNSVMTTPTFNTFGLASLNLSFDHAFNLLTGAWVSVELSVDGGTTWGVTLAQWTGPQTRMPYNNFPNTTIDLSAYLGQANLKVRFVYHGTVGSSWAVDNIMIPDAPSNVATQWVNAATGQVISTTATATVSPLVTTTYEITTTLNGCTSFGPDGTTYVTVTVNQRPTAHIGSDQTICYGGTATFSIDLTGSAPWSITYSNGATTATVNNVMVTPYILTVPNVTANRTYTLTNVSDSRCTATPADLTGSAAVTVLNGIPGLWTGLVSTDWFDCMNWAGGLPSLSVDAQIPSGAPRMPMINPATSPFAAGYGNVASARDLVVASGASVNMAAAGIANLQISRDWRNSGIFNPGTGTVSFVGATPNQVQNINMGIKTNETFYNLTTNATNGAKGVSVVDGFQLVVNNWVTLTSGDIRLTGEAQLLQSGAAANPITGSGRLLRDQQGTKSSFNYNYWSSPVSADGVNYTVGGVLRDGTDVTTNPFAPATIAFGSGAFYADGPASNPIKISTSWINKFTLASSSYNSWQAIGSTGNVKVGEGYTMKGTDGTVAVSAQQNYVFAGKPNSGTINLSIGAGQSYLIGNPYPSALDANQFILDNIKDGGNAAVNAFSGALYFWDHFAGHTHYLSQYVGGYATYTLMGGVVAVANDPMNINDGATGTKIPKRYIPVAQAFFIRTDSDTSLTTNNPNMTSPITGGPVVFKNSQRAFKTESPSNSVFIRSSAVMTDAEEMDLRPKIRLVMTAPTGVYRQILIGADANATDGFDLGYDAPMIDAGPDDMYWEMAGAKLSIQAVPDFDAARIVPIGLTLSENGETAIAINTLENTDADGSIFLHDGLAGTDHDLTTAPFLVTLPAGIHANRFSLRFSATVLGTTQTTAGDWTLACSEKMLKIRNRNNVRIDEVALYDLAGQQLAHWETGQMDQHNLRLPVKGIAQAIYIVKITTATATESRKILID